MCFVESSADKESNVSYGDPGPSVSEADYHTTTSTTKKPDNLPSEEYSKAKKEASELRSKINEMEQQKESLENELKIWKGKCESKIFQLVYNFSAVVPREVIKNQFFSVFC